MTTKDIINDKLRAQMDPGEYISVLHIGQLTPQ